MQSTKPELINNILQCITAHETPVLADKQKRKFLSCVPTRN